MALALGEVESARLYESLYEKGRKYTEQHLFNGQYFVQNIDINDRSILQPYEEEGSPTGGSTVETYWNTETKEIKYQIGKGCHIDQVLAQWMADLCGIGDIVSRDMVVSALRSIYRNYFLESLQAWFIFLVLLGLLCAGNPASAAPGDTLVVGHTTRLSGSFFTEMWGNNTSDIDVRELLHAYPTVVWTEEGDLFINQTVTQSLDRTLDAEGNTVLTVTIKPGLQFSDGSPITAADYVFSIILESSPLIPKLGGQAVIKGFIVGVEDYASGLSDKIRGLRLLDDHSFSITVSKDALPYFYDLAYAHALPYALSVIAPGCGVKDDGEGVYMDGPFTEELLRESIFNPMTGYLSHPSVVSGPYTLTGFDVETIVATFKRNPYFKGNHEGIVPTIENLVFQQTTNDSMLDELRDGTLGLVNKISSGVVIDQLDGLNAQGIANNIGYPRTGLGFLAFGTELGFSASATLRQAITHLIDKQVIVDQFLHGHGEPVYGYYGLGQWMARQRKGELKQLDIYPYDQAAAALLDADGWNLNSKGEAYDAGQRYKKAGDFLLPLSLRMAVSPMNAAGDLVAELLRENLEEVGGKLTVEIIPMTELFEHYYRQRERGYDLLFLGSNFPFVFDPYYNYNSDTAYQGAYNTSGVRDEELFQLAKHLRETPSGDKETYLDRWITFQKGWVRLMPFVPLYSNTYYDAFTPRLVNYHPESHTSWAIAILYAQLK